MSNHRCRHCNFPKFIFNKDYGACVDNRKKVLFNIFYLFLNFRVIPFAFLFFLREWRNKTKHLNHVFKIIICKYRNYTSLFLRKIPRQVIKLSRSFLYLIHLKVFILCNPPYVSQFSGAQDKHPPGKYRNLKHARVKQLGGYRDVYVLPTLYWECSSFNFNNWTHIKVLKKHLCIDGCRHKNNSKIGISFNHVTKNYQCKVGLQKKKHSRNIHCKTNDIKYPESYNS